jgi:hypothetical protein
MKALTLSLTLFTFLFGAALPSQEAKANDAEKIFGRIADEILRRMPVPEDRFAGRRDKVVLKRVDERFRGMSTINLNRYLELGKYRGRDVKSVILIAKSQAGFGMATLVVNGREIRGRERVSRDLDDYEFELPRHSNEIGDDIRNLRIKLQGNFYVKAVGLELDRRDRDDHRDRDGRWGRDGRGGRDHDGRDGRGGHGGRR